MKNVTNSKYLYIATAIVGIAGVFYFLRKKMKEAKSAQNNENETIADSEKKLDGQEIRPIGAGLPKKQSSLISKKINSVKDLIGTPLGTFISIELANPSQKQAVDILIKNKLSLGEKSILDNIALPQDEVRDSIAYDDLLNKRFGKEASKLKAQIIEKLASASRGNVVISKIEDTKEYKDLVARFNKEVQDIQKSGNTPIVKAQLIKAAKVKFDIDLENLHNTLADYSVGKTNSFSSDDLSTEDELFAFNGHVF